MMLLFRNADRIVNSDVHYARLKINITFRDLKVKENTNKIFINVSVIFTNTNYVKKNIADILYHVDH